MIRSKLSGLPLIIKSGSLDSKAGTVLVKRGEADEWFKFPVMNIQGPTWEVEKALGIGGQNEKKKV